MEMDFDHHIFRANWEEGESWGGVVRGKVRVGLVDKSRDAVR